MSVFRRDRVFDRVAPPIAETQIDVSRGTILYVEGVTVSFDGFRALNDLNLYIDDGELRCIIGPNGAGKTTMMDVITGKTRPDSGSVNLGQRLDLLSLSEPQIAELGVGRKFQRPTVFENHDVYTNLELALAGPRGTTAALLHRSTPEERDRIDDVLSVVGLRDEAMRSAAILSHGQKQWLEIGMLLAQQPRVLLVDEPVAGMTQRETEQTAELLTSLAGKHCVVVVENDMEFVRSIARKVTVLHEGRVLAEGDMDTIASDPRVIEVYLGD
jgi:urea transport system ATP-binding protein